MANRNLTDGDGFLWDLYDTPIGYGGLGSSIENGTGDAFDLGLLLSIAGINFTGAFGADELGGRQLVLTGTSNGLDVVRRVYVPDDAGAGWARFLESFTNNTGTAITVTVSIQSNSGNDGNFTILDTSSGDTAFTTADNWIINDDAPFGDGFGDPVVLHLFGDGSAAPTSVGNTVFNAADNQGVTFSFSITVNPGETVSILHFASQQTTAADMQAELTTIENLGGNALFGLSADQISSIANWNAGAPPANTAPQGTDNTVVLAEDSSYTFAAADFGFTDADGGDSLQSVRITTLPTDGTLTLSGTPVSAGDVIAAANIGNLVFTPAPDGFGTGYADFTFQVSDGTDEDATPNTLTLDVTPVNDGPVNTVPASQTINEDGSVVFSSSNGNAISITDDAVGSGVTVTLAATEGVLTLSRTDGLVITTGDGSADATIVLTGSVAAINAALDGLTYTPDEDFFGNASVTITTNDNGNTGSGGALQDSDTVAITVEEMPDTQSPPDNSGDDILTGDTNPNAFDGGPGNDTVSYAGADGGVFINLTLGQGYGNSAQGDTFVSVENVIGTSVDDFIIGDPGINRLDGGAGNDTLIGGLGPDVLIGGPGIDTASYEDNSGVVFVNLALGQGFNNAAEGDTLEGIENLIGGLFDDFFIGDDGANRLDGALGADTLVGNGGADVFVFKHSPGAASGFDNPNSNANVDTILDFTTGEDTIELAGSIFTALSEGTLDPDAFVLGTEALDADDRIIYDAETGNLYYDADGAGGADAVLFAVLDNQAPIAATDFVITAP